MLLNGQVVERTNDGTAMISNLWMANLWTDKLSEKYGGQK